jgi:Helicase associated domain
LGKGKRVTEWPGNQLFRKLVARHREAYAKTERTGKASVALVVMQEVKDYGGRFLQEVEAGSDQWIIIDDARAVQKVCRALTKMKECAHRPVSVERNAALTGKRKQQRLEKAAAAVTLPKIRRDDDWHEGLDKTESHDESVDETASENDQGDVDEEGDSSVVDNEEGEAVGTVGSVDVAGTDDTEETETEDDASDSSANNALVVPDSLPKKRKFPHREAFRLARKTVPIDKLKGGISMSGQTSADGGEDHMERCTPPIRKTRGPIGGPPKASDLLNQHHTHYLDRLKEFKSRYGHCAVPPVRPGSSDLAYDAKFAEWCSRQRQLHREVRVEQSRFATSSESDRLARLDALGFVFDYDEHLVKKGDLGAARSVGSIWQKCHHDHYIDRLKEYKSTYGHCAVPPVLVASGDFANDSRFVEWCICQRQLHREVRVKQSRIATSSELERLMELDMLSFVFDYDELVDWKKENHEYSQWQQGTAPVALHMDAAVLAQSSRRNADVPETPTNLGERAARNTEQSRKNSCSKPVLKPRKRPQKFGLESVSGTNSVEHIGNLECALSTSFGSSERAPPRTLQVQQGQLGDGLQRQQHEASQEQLLRQDQLRHHNSRQNEVLQPRQQPKKRKARQQKQQSRQILVSEPHQWPENLLQGQPQVQRKARQQKQTRQIVVSEPQQWPENLLQGQPQLHHPSPPLMFPPFFPPVPFPTVPVGMVPAVPQSWQVDVPQQTRAYLEASERCRHFPYNMPDNVP